MATVFCGFPLYNRQADIAASVRAFCPKTKHRVLTKPMGTSLIPRNCNELYCEAMNRRAKDGIGWYAQLHSDIEPPPDWIDSLIEEADRHGADFLSAVIPIKDRTAPESAGSTSTAIAHPTNEFRIHCRLTQKQVNHPTFPATFDIHGVVTALAELPDELRITDAPRSFLLANTGCMVFRIDRDWPDDVCFSNPCRIERMNGQRKPAQRPEDWYFTQRIAEAGGKVMATKMLHVKHWGFTDFDSHETWGLSRNV